MGLVEPGRPLPLVLSIPHGGTRTPPELADRVDAGPADVFADGDAFTPEIYDVGTLVAHVQAAEVARAFVDLNRAPDDRPPKNADGVVKTATCYGVPMYREALDAALVEEVLDRYYHPYHAALAEAARRPGMWLALDCHSMAATPPPVAPDAGRPRPLFCLSNGEGATCDAELLQRLARCFREAFECAPDQVALNAPFQGGYVTRHHGRNPLPWIQVEMNRALYLREPWFDPATRTLSPLRAGELRARFARALALLCAAG